MLGIPFRLDYHITSLCKWRSAYGRTVSEADPLRGKNCSKGDTITSEEADRHAERPANEAIPGETIALSGQPRSCLCVLALHEQDTVALFCFSWKYIAEMIKSQEEVVTLARKQRKHAGVESRPSIRMPKQQLRLQMLLEYGVDAQTVLGDGLCASGAVRQEYCECFLTGEVLEEEFLSQFAKPAARQQVDTDIIVFLCSCSWEMVRLPPITSGPSADIAGQRPSAASAPARRNAAVRSSARPKKPPIYWQLFGASAPLYRGPLGVVVGEAGEGTVIREVRRYRDPFGSWWVASRSVDGSLVWLSFASPVNEGRVAEWRRVYDEREQNIPDTPCASEVAVLKSSSVSPNVNTKVFPPLDDVCELIRVLGKSWCLTFSEPTTHTRDWNAEYQNLVERYLFGESEMSASAHHLLHQFMDEFTSAAEEAALGVVAELLLPVELRTTKGIAEETNYFARNGLLVQLLSEDSSGAGDKSTERAWRDVLQLTHAQQMLALEAPKHLLCTIPMVVVTFCGVRICVVAIAPIELRNILYLPMRKLHDGGEETPSFVEKRLIDVGSALSLGSHVVGRAGKEKDDVKVVMSADVAVVKGNDKRLYIIGSNRLLPELALVGNEGSMGDSVENSVSDGCMKTLRFRPEFLLRWKKPMNPDAFVECATSPEDNATVVEATEFIRDHLIPAVAAVIGFHQPVDIPLQDVVECTLCSNSMENELRFVACRSKEKCCHICSHCYTKRLSEKGDGARDVFSDAVRCGSGFRGPKGLLLQPSITSLFHTNGLNMRFLPFVLNAIPESTRFAVEHYCQIEMVARAAVRVFRSKLCTTSHVIDEVKCISQNLFLGLLQSSGHIAERFWSKEIGPTIEKMYGPLEPFNTEKMDVELLYHRVAELSGIALSDASVTSLYGEGSPFLQLESIEPVVKTVLPPNVVDEAVRGELRRRLHDGLGEVLLFWIGAFPNDAENAAHGKKSANEPFYLTNELI